MEVLQMENLIQLYKYFRNLNINCVNYDMLENFLLFEDIDNEQFKYILFELEKLNISFNQLVYIKKDLLIALNEF